MQEPEASYTETSTMAGPKGNVFIALIRWADDRLLPDSVSNRFLELFLRDDRLQHLRALRIGRIRANRCPNRWILRNCQLTDLRTYRVR